MFLSDLVRLVLSIPQKLPRLCLQFSSHIAIDTCFRRIHIIFFYRYRTALLLLLILIPVIISPRLFAILLHPCGGFRRKSQKLTGFIVMCCFVVGSVCILLILVKYIRSRHLFASLQASGSHQLSTSGGTAYTGSAANHKHTPQAAKIRTDKWLLLRFSICFLILR